MRDMDPHSCVLGVSLGVMMEGMETMNELMTEQTEIMNELMMEPTGAGISSHALPLCEDMAYVARRCNLSQSDFVPCSYRAR